MSRVKPSPQGLYVHVPFCARACPYCDFDFRVGPAPPADDFVDALRRECEGRAVAPRPSLHTVYVGGGTPSQLGAAGLTTLMHWIHARFDTHAAVECTVELNPEHVDAALVDALVGAGVSRVSMGVQSLAPDALATLGRAHRAAQAAQALRTAVAAGVHVSADLIVGWPGQTEASLRADIDDLLETGVDHVSIYALTIEPGTPWIGLVDRGQRAMPDADRQAERLLLAEAHLQAAGLEHYEVASYARPGARAQHNQGYWQWIDYLGLGPSAASARYHADGGVTRRTNVRGHAGWTKAPADGAEIERLGAREAAAEGLWIGLRRLDGISVDAMLGRFAGIDEDWIRRRVARQVARGNLEWTAHNRLQVAPGRWLWHDEIGADLLDDVGDHPSETAR